jgi:hypothetical protein
VSAPRTVRLSDRFHSPCEVVDRLAVRYFFNGLPRGQHEALRRHFLGCPRCLKKLKVFGRAWALGAGRAPACRG